MQCEKCLRTLASALVVATAVLALSDVARASTFKIIHQFEIPQYPFGNLTIDASGNLYGTTIAGGEGSGVVWKLAPNGVLTMLHKFTGGADGASPKAGLIFDASGNLYGTTIAGGEGTCSFSPGGCGVVFKLAPKPGGTWTESVLYSFTGGADGAGPVAGLIFDTAGNLYGTAGGGSAACTNGCGVVFKLAPNPDGTWAETVLYSFTGGADGKYPGANLTFDGRGNLYSMTYDGGSNSPNCTGGCGVVFKLAPNPEGSWTESVLYSFTGGTDGGNPIYSGVIFDAAGNLYGTTELGGGAANQGVVFKLAPNPDGIWTESVLYSFTGGADGGNPQAGLIFDAAGNLYGAAQGGGGSFGVVFKLTPTSSGWSETVLRKFLGEGESPLAPVIFDSKGNLYGTTNFGMGNYGTVFEITP